MSPSLVQESDLLGWSWSRSWSFLFKWSFGQNDLDHLCDLDLWSRSLFKWSSRTLLSWHITRPLQNSSYSGFRAFDQSSKFRTWSARARGHQISREFYAFEPECLEERRASPNPVSRWMVIDAEQSFTLARAHPLKSSRGAIHKWRQLHIRDFGPFPPHLSVPNPRNLPNFNQNLGKPPSSLLTSLMHEP